MKPVIKAMLIAGIACLLAPFAGFFFTVVGMVGTFHALGNSGISDPKILAGHIGTTLVATMVGFVVGTIGLITIVIAAIVHYTTRPAPPEPSP